MKTPIKIADGLYSMGPVDGNPPEQALVIETAKWSVVLTAAQRLCALGVASVSATHCTGDLPMRLFAKAYGSQSATAGAGKRIVLD